MSKDAVFTMKLESALRNDFIAEADAAHRPASQIIRELMRDFIQKQRELRSHEQYVSQKMNAARASLQAGVGIANEDVEAEFAARRARAKEKD